MRWSFKIATVFGIPIRIHVTFLVLLFWIGTKPAGLAGMTLILSIFFCVILHELGHSLVARKYGIVVDSITLLPIGGVASMKSLPQSARAELLMAMAGPGVSVAVGIILMLTARYLYGPWIWQAFIPDNYDLPLLAELAVINFFLAAFNLIPAFPMDGGRVLRAILWSRKGFMRATVIAAKIGQILAVGCFLLAMMYSNTMLVLIAIFIYFGAEAEGKAAVWVDKFSVLTVGQTMQTNLKTIQPDATVKETALLMANTGQDNFPVVDNTHQPAGVLTRQELLLAIREEKFDHPVRDFMTKQLICCRSFDNLATVLHLMDRQNLSCVLVIDEDHIVGLITPEMLYRIIK
ncbi:MAG: site-2 protease family protein [Phycisphaerae bacterium]